MQQKTTPAIVLRRTNYGEADRIVSFLTPTGKIKALVKGVRRSKSKLAGGIELFSVSTITFMETRGDLARIISTRLETHYDGIVGDLSRMMFGYEAMKLLDTAVEDEAEPGYYNLLKETLQALADKELSFNAIELWFYVRFLRLQGREPNLKSDSTGAKLRPEARYDFSVEEMCFVPNSRGMLSADHIKLLRLFLGHNTSVIKHIKGVDELSGALKPIFNLLTGNQM